MKILLQLFILLLLTNCYVYRASNESSTEKKTTLKEKIKADKYYHIKANDKVYKVKTENWEQDSLVTYVDFKEDKIKKFHQNEIQEVRNRIFSRGRSDALTFAVYGGIAGLIIFLLQ